MHVYKFHVRSSNLPSPILSRSWRWLLGTIKCWGSWAINSSVTWNPAAHSIGDKMNVPTAITNSSVTWAQDKFSYNTITKLGQYTKQCLVYCLVCSPYTTAYLQFFLTVVCFLQQVHCIEIDLELSLWHEQMREIMCSVGLILWWPISNICMHCRNLKELITVFSVYGAWTPSLQLSRALQ